MTDLIIEDISLPWESLAMLLQCALSIFTMKHCLISFAAFDWIWAESTALNTSQFILLLVSAVTPSINTRDLIPLAGNAVASPVTMVDRWYSAAEFARAVGLLRNVADYNKVFTQRRPPSLVLMSRWALYLKSHWKALWIKFWYFVYYICH